MNMSTEYTQHSHDSEFGDFVDYTATSKAHDQRINALYAEMLDKYESECSSCADFAPETANSVLESPVLDQNRCEIIYNQLFHLQHQEPHNFSPRDLEEYLSNLFHQSITYNHLIQVLNIDTAKTNSSTDNNEHISDTETILHTNNLTEKVLSFIKELEIHSNTDGNEDYLSELKTRYTSLIVGENEHLTILTDPDIFSLTMDLVKEKVLTANLAKDNEIYKSIVESFIEQSQRSSREKMKKKVLRR